MDENIDKKVDIVHKFLQLALQIVTVISLISSMYLSMKLQPIVSALEGKTSNLEFVEITAIIKQQISSLSSDINYTNNAVKSVSDKVDRHLER